MAAFQGDVSNDLADALAGTLTGFTGGSVAELQDSVGDSFLGQGGNDSITSGNGADFIRGGSGRDTVNSGGGSDTIQVLGNEDIDNVDGGAGTDLLELSSITAVTNPGAPKLQINLDAGTWILDPVGGQASISNIENIIGSALKNEIIGNAAANLFVGNNDDDLMVGGLGNDTLSGAGGNDFLTGDAVNLTGVSGTGILNRAANTNNNNIATAINISESTNLYSLAPDSNIGGADYMRHLTVVSSADDAVAIAHFYSINLLAGQTVIFDIDNTLVGQSDVVLRLSNGGFTVALADNSDPTLGAGGSSSNADSYLTYTAPADGLYTLEVGRSGSGNVLDRTLAPVTFVADATNSYRLNISLSAMSGAGNDSLTGGDGSDTLLGGGGDDTLDGGRGVDVVLGGDGNDQFNFTHGATFASDNQDVIDGGAGIDQIRLLNTGNDFDFSVLSPDAPMRSIEQVYLEGSNNAIFDSRQFSADRINPNAEFLTAGGSVANAVTINVQSASGFIAAGFTFTNWDANDRLIINNSLGGGTTITGSSVVDVITGNIGADTLSSGSGNDTLTGSGGADSLIGGEGDDWLEGENGNAVTMGIAGNDIIEGGNGNDTVLGGAGNDLITGAAGTDVLVGEIGNDTISGGSEFDAIDGRENNDVLNGDGGNDIIFGDGFYIEKGFGSDTISGGDGDDIIMGEAGENYTVGAADLINGDAGNDLIDGGAGDDTIFGGDGNDVIDGDHGNDTIIGGSGSETMLGSNAVAFGGPTIGSDLFVYQAITDQGDNIYGFDTRAGDADSIDFRQLFDTLGYTGNTPRANGYLYVFQNTTNTDVYVDADGAANGINLNTRMFTLVDVTATSLTDSFFLFQ